jgi:gamma-glutamylcyclotransferase (GGCT)/AIG2-like uncharacterized protein YtfP
MKLKSINKLPKLYFGYGSNMNHNQMSFRCPTAQFVRSFYLKGWELEFGSHATIVPKHGAVVPGALWLLTDSDIAALDRYEGYPVYYNRRRWRQDNEHFFFYEMQRPIVGSPSMGYVLGIAEGYQQCGIKLQYLKEKVKPKIHAYHY